MAVIKPSEVLISERHFNKKEQETSQISYEREEVKRNLMKPGCHDVYLVWIMGALRYLYFHKECTSLSENFMGEIMPTPFRACWSDDLAPRLVKLPRFIRILLQQLFIEYQWLQYFNKNEL